MIASDNASVGANSLRAVDPDPAGQTTQFRTIEWTFNTRAASLLLDHDLLPASSTEYLQIRLNGGTRQTRRYYDPAGWQELGGSQRFTPILLRPGINTLRFEFRNRRNTGGAEGQAWIDNIRITEIGGTP